MWFLSHSPGRTVGSTVWAGNPTRESCSYSMAEVLGNYQFSLEISGRVARLCNATPNSESQSGSRGKATGHLEGYKNTSVPGQKLHMEGWAFETPEPGRPGTWVCSRSPQTPAADGRSFKINQ